MAVESGNLHSHSALFKIQGVSAKCTFKKLGGVNNSKFRKHDFEIAVDPKGPHIGQTFWSGLEAQTIRGTRGGNAHFPRPGVTARLKLKVHTI